MATLVATITAIRVLCKHHNPATTIANHRLETNVATTIETTEQASETPQYKVVRTSFSHKKHHNDATITAVSVAHVKEIRRKTLASAIITVGDTMLNVPSRSGQITIVQVHHRRIVASIITEATEVRSVTALHVLPYNLLKQ